jgi:hypothetical protein
VSKPGEIAEMVRKRKVFGSLNHRWYVEKLKLEPLLRGPPLWHINVGNFIFVPFSGHIKIAVAAAIFGHIRLPVDTRANDVFIPLCVASCQPTRAGHVAVALLVGEQSLQEIKDPFLILIEIITFGFLVFP